MILKNFFGKTIDAAQKSAQQMFGEDFVVLSSTPASEKEEAGITVMFDKKESPSEVPVQEKSENPESEEKSEGVKFERSKSSGQNDQIDKLKELRALYKRRTSDNQDATGPAMNGQKSSREEIVNSSPVHSYQKNGKSHSNSSIYNRASIRPVEPANGEAVNGALTKDAVDKKRRLKLPENSLLARIRETDPAKGPGITAYSTRQNKREITALHKRFDKLEALLDSALISSNLDYVSHPAFQQLVQTGISTSIIAGWFSNIIKDGVDPYDHPEKFMSQLSSIIRNAINKPVAEETQKFLLFTGPSGSGKTRLIMKLSQHSGFMKDKKVAVVSVYPRKNNGSPYYTVLEAFCTDHNLPYFKVTNEEDVTSLLEEWEPFDHVLIDTPSISLEKESVFREYWKIRQTLSPISSPEVHYVVNAALNRFYFENSSAIHHPLKPDFVAITHLDQVSQWGAIIPFLKEMGCGARYISTGNSVPEGLQKFEPKWFAQQVLQNT
ncbi:MAG TPA: hypothetical protein VJ905_08330 [Halalkalibaculum sp.]|nr:hypothetical protein [Halalkalibaculum sp.]